MVDKNPAILKNAMTRKTSNWSSRGWRTQAASPLVLIMGVKTLKTSWGCWERIRRLPVSKVARTAQNEERKSLSWLKKWPLWEKTIITPGPDQAEFETTPQSHRRRRKCKRTAGSSAVSKATARGELWKEVDDYIFSWEPERRRSGTSNAKKSGKWGRAATRNQKIWSTT